MATSREVPWSQAGTGSRSNGRHLFVLRTGLRWHDLPAEMGCGFGVTRWHRLRDWQAGVWDRLPDALLADLRKAGQIDLSRVVVDSSSVRAIGAGQKLG